MASNALSNQATTRQRRSGLQITRVALYLIAGAATLYFLFPLIWLLMASTKNNSDLYTSSAFWFAHFNLVANLQQLLTYDNGIYLQWMGNTFLYAFGSASLSILISALAGYALAKFTFPGKKLIFNVIVCAVLVPGTVLVLPLYLLMSSVHLVNTYWSVLLPSLFSAFGIWFSYIYADASIPKELLEAARMDGAGELRIFFTVGLRLMSPALATVFLFHFVGVWNSFFLPLMMLSNEHLYPLSVGLYLWNQVGTDATYSLTNLMITGSLLAALPIVLSFVFLQRYWRSGLSLGSIVG
ncbi:sugar ABC transporter permease [Ktedonobacter sp. SOSP1-52]|uniref:carbohydrate ABC transporter permease n=1 Tax=Ktedonobacter sp. SOSP1-52 TaxID=2778366 RepID=UPI001916A78A|nr:carbohydrate ABC transporter permease [Ktedonobacter sp. SOSP1-52]GHO62045.1 sugar ABC transporter permease [Ktedonobacter sp. SOSP1-52]